MFSSKADVLDGGFHCNPELAVSEHTAFPKTIGILVNRNNPSNCFHGKTIVQKIFGFLKNFLSTPTAFSKLGHGKIILSGSVCMM